MSQRYRRNPPKIYKRDSRYSPRVEKKAKKRIKDLNNLLQKKLKISEIAWYRGYGSAIATNNRMFVFSKEHKEVVPIGNFMGWWEPAFKQYGIKNILDWDKLSLKEKKAIETKHQARVWAKKNYKSDWLEIYKPKAHDKMWWEERRKLPEAAQYNLNHPKYIKLVEKTFNKFNEKKELNNFEKIEKSLIKRKRKFKYMNKNKSFIHLSMSNDMYFNILKRKNGRTVITKNFMDNDYNVTSYRISYSNFTEDLKDWK